MKNFLFTCRNVSGFVLLLCLYSVPLFSQIQTGLVREQNSNKTPLPNVQVIFSDALPASSDQSGKFRLAFSNKKPGDLIFFQEIAKKGYEIVNEKELQVLKMGTSDNLSKDIILAKAGQLDAAKKEYYGISDKALREGFIKEKNALQEKLKNVQLTQQEYLDKFNALSEQYEQQQKALDNLADVFARTNFDDVSGEYKQAFELFKTGKIDEALKILESTNLLNRTEKRLKEKKRIEAAATKIAEQKEQNEKEIQEDLQGLQLQAQLYVLTFQVEKAEGLYDQVLRLDSTDLDILSRVSDFYRENHRYSKALRILTHIITHPKAEPWQKANSQGRLGEMYTAIGQLESALQSFMASQKAYATMLQADTGSSFYKSNLAVSYGKLGETHTTLGNLEKGLTFFEQRSQLGKELYMAYPQNMLFKFGLAHSYSRLGSTHTLLGNLENALIFFEKDNQLSKELYAAYPQNLDFKSSLAISYQNLGVTYFSLDNLDSALDACAKTNQIFGELFAAYSQNVDFKDGLARSYSNLGLIYTARDNLDKALTCFERYNQLEQELYATYPQNVSFKNGVAISCEKLGQTHYSLGNLERALTLFEKDLELSDELYAAYPQNVDFKDGVASSYTNLGSMLTLLGNLDKALTSFEKGNKLEEELYVAYPQNISFKKGLAFSYEKLGETHTSLGNLILALTFFEKETKMFEELYAAHPQNVKFKNSLAISYSKLGESYTSLDNLDNALFFFERYNLLRRELHVAYPQNVPLKNSLALSYASLGQFILDQRNDKTKAREYFQQAEVLWSELVRDAPKDMQFQRFSRIVQGILSDLDEEDPLSSFNVRIQNEPDTLSKYQLCGTLCNIMREKAMSDPQQKAAFAVALNSHAWFGFFLQKFEAVEASIQEGLAWETGNKFLEARLAPALLLQGKKDAALAEYKKWMDKPFGEPDYPTYREAFLDDLNTFEKAGIIPAARQADVAAVRKMLEEK